MGKTFKYFRGNTVKYFLYGETFTYFLKYLGFFFLFFKFTKMYIQKVTKKYTKKVVKNERRKRKLPICHKKNGQFPKKKIKSKNTLNNPKKYPKN